MSNRKRLLATAAAVALGWGVAGYTGPAGVASAADAPAGAASASAPLTLEKGQHVCIIGNTLAERMQHDGWLETLIHARHPEHDIVIRNLGYSGDELTLRLRSADFGSPDEWLAGEAKHPAGAAKIKDKSVLNGDNRFALTNTKADVVFAFFGYNESWAGEAGLDKFKKDLDGTLKGMLSKKYNGRSAPRIVLFSPIAFENHKSPHLPDGEAVNKNIKLYAGAMSEVAKANDVTFVDLFGPTQALYAAAKSPLTINGIHLNDEGNRALAGVITDALFGKAGGGASAGADLKKLNEAVRDKNFHWFRRYRTTDGFSVHGGRAFLFFKPDDQSNYEVAQRELRIIDQLTSNRDRRIWSLARGQDAKVDDSNTDPFIPVKTNKPGPNPDGSHKFLSGAESVERMKVAKGLKVNLFASEEQFPELINPVQMAFDTKGRLWVATWPSYPHWTPKNPLSDRLLILEDTDNDGKADRSITFAGDLDNPTGFEFWNGGVIVSQGSEIVFLKDSDGDDRYDQKVRMLHGLDTADTHHTANSFTFDPGGALYFQEGTFHHSQVESPWGPPERIANGAVWRFEPTTYKVEPYTSYGFANPHGHVFDKWGADVVIDGTGAVPYYGPAFSGKTYFPQKHSGKAPTVYKQRTRPCPAAEILTSKHFPDEYQGNLLVPNVIGFLGILNYKLAEKGAGLVGTEVEPMLSSDDPNFRPSDVEVAPDGAVYFTDWHNPIIGHMQHNLRDPNRNKTHGRVYRVTAEGRPLLKPAKVAGEPVDKLVALLTDPDNRVRYRAKIELSSRDSKEVLSAVDRWSASLDKADPKAQHALMEALWVYQWHNTVNEPLLKQMLRSPEPLARAAATRVLCYQRDRVPGVLDLLKVQANDDHPRVRLEAVRACSFFTDPKAIDVALESLNKDQDEFLKYTLDETMKTLEKATKAPKGGANASDPKQATIDGDFDVRGVPKGDKKK